MIVHIKSDVFGIESNFQKLNHMFAFFEDGKHILFLNEDISATDWAKSTSKTTREFCEVEFKNSIYSSVTKVNLKIDTKNDLEKDTYSVYDAYILLQNNSIIFVENATSDGLFLKSIINNFTECDSIKNGLKKRWIGLKGVGGKNEFIKEINNELRKFRYEALPSEKYLRAIVIIDSDKKYPSESLSDIHTSIIDYCDEKKIKHHVLEKREIENYLPVQVFADFPHNHQIVSSYLNLNNIQQSFYDFEKGFDGKKISTLDINIQNLYTGLSEVDEQHLRVGFNKSFKNGFSSKKVLPLLFKHSSISRENLLENCAMQDDPEEIIEIIKKLEHLL
ncbi:MULTISPECIES: hypothetical protein [Flavobacterium]|uniref:hypothetical protein n=1 Tax=Flavobacterium TaxID=237 RepID=UPI002114E41B|nr:MULTISPECIES: hypothetical protein [Flavobacterium]UUF15196.1 hypothetical protein NLJ00_03615 [Flavobacterium panici]